MSLYKSGQVTLFLNLGHFSVKRNNSAFFTQWLGSFNKLMAREHYKLKALCHRSADRSPEDKMDWLATSERKLIIIKKHSHAYPFTFYLWLP